MAVPVPALHGASTVLTTAETTTWYNVMQFLLAPPRCRATSSATTTTGTAITWTSVAYNSESYDSTGMHDNVTNNTRITIAQPGYYRLSPKYQCSVNTTVGIRFAVQGTGLAETEKWSAFASGSYADATLETTVYITAGQYVEVQASAIIATVALGGSFFEAHWVGN